MLKSDGTTEHVDAKNVIIATGSEPAEPPMFDIDETQVLTTTGILNLTELPESLIIVGGGVSGCEFASIFNALGCRVTVLELLPTILATEDVQIIRHIQLFMKRKGIQIRTGAKLTQVKKTDTHVTAVLASGEELTAEKMLISIGRRFNTEGIGLEQVGVRTDAGKIRVDSRMQTNVPGIYAVGDVASRYLLAHVASAEGKGGGAKLPRRNRDNGLPSYPLVRFHPPRNRACRHDRKRGDRRRGMKSKWDDFPTPLTALH